MDVTLSATRIDYYRMLGLEPSTPAETVRDMYKVLARRLHPDIAGTPAAARAMSAINSAYQAIVGRPAAADFTIEATPVLRRAQAGNEAIVRYRETMGDGDSSLGSLVDVLA